MFQKEVLQKVQLIKLNKKQIQLINNNVFVASDRLFEVFVGIPDGLTINNFECNHSVKRYKILLNRHILVLLFYAVAFVLFTVYF